MSEQVNTFDFTNLKATLKDLSNFISCGNYLKTPLLALVLAALLSACAIPYDTPEARGNIERDLNLNADEIVTIEETNWCLFGYGDVYPCRMAQGLGVLTKTGLVLVYYKGGHYQQAEVIKSSDVQCAHLQSGVETHAPFYLFSARWVAMLAVVGPKEAALRKKRQFLSVLVPSGTEAFVGAQGNFIEATGRKNYSAVPVPGTPIYVGTSEGINQMVNPCTQGKK